MGYLIIFLPLAAYIIAAFSVPKKLLQKPADFYTAYKKVGKTAFSSSSIAYAFQASTIYPFFLWGASKFFFVPFVNTIGWGLGILLFLWAFNKWRNFISKDLTMHGFMGETYGKGLRTAASYITIVGFIGFIISETYFGSKVLLSVIGNRNLFYLVIFGSILMIYFYITWGGQLSSVRTDQIQLIVSYLGVFSTLVYLSYLMVISRSVIPYELKIGLIIIAIYIPLILFLRKGRFIQLSELKSPTTNIFNWFFNILIVLLLVSLVGISVYKLFQNNSVSPAHNLINLEGFGIPGLISLIILPLTFQFVDLTNWQRILSVNTDNADQESLNKKIKKGLLIYAVESPFTWLIFIFFGLLAVSALSNFSFQDLLIDFPKHLILSTDILQNIFGYIFIISILSIMLSTIDSFIVGLIYTYAYDINKKTRKLIESKNEIALKENYNLVTKAGKYFGIITASLAVILFIVFDKAIVDGGELFINLLLAFYSAQLSFFPLIFGKLFLKNRPSEGWAILSMLIGACSGISLGIYSVIWNPVYGWYPIIVCFVLSSLTYVIGIFVSPKINKA